MELERLPIGNEVTFHFRLFYLKRTSFPVDLDSPRMFPRKWLRNPTFLGGGELGSAFTPLCPSFGPATCFQLMRKPLLRRTDLVPTVTSQLWKFYAYLLGRDVPFHRELGLLMGQEKPIMISGPPNTSPSSAGDGWPEGVCVYWVIINIPKSRNP